MSPNGKIIEKYFNIYDKRGELVPFKLNNVQRIIDEQIMAKGLKRVSILKGRQFGITTYIIAYFLVECMNSYKTAVLVAHDKESTIKLLQRAQVMIKNLKSPDGSRFNVETSRMNDNEITFKDTNSTFYIGTAGSKGLGRSAAINLLHLSEIAFYDDPKKMLAGLHPAVPPEGIITQETTANGWGTWFQQAYYKYMKGEGVYTAFFLPWNIHGEYKSLTKLTYNQFTDEEKMLADEFKLTPQQIQWRRGKLEENEGDILSFQKEYPLTVKEAFTLSGGSLFEGLSYGNNKGWRNVSRIEKRLKDHPIEGYHYVIGIDCAGGSGFDSSTMVGICIEEQTQVLEYKYNKIKPYEFAELILSVGVEYNDAYLVPERNNMGVAVVEQLMKTYPKGNIYFSKSQRTTPANVKSNPVPAYGYLTSKVTKSLMISVSQRLLREGWIIYSKDLFDELLSFTEDEGNIVSTAPHDDLAMGFMLACMGVLDIYKKLGIIGWNRETKEAIYPKRVGKINVGDKIDGKETLGTFDSIFPDFKKKKKKRKMIGFNRHGKE